MLVGTDFVGLAYVPPNVTVLASGAAPKPVPVIVMIVPTAPDVADSFVITGGVPTVNGTPSLASPPTVTTMSPVLAPAGTATSMLVGTDFVGLPFVPPNVTVL